MFFAPSRKDRSALAARPRGVVRRPWFETLESRCLLSAGTLDSTFGTGGFVTTSLSAGEDTGNAVDLQTDGKIVVAGTTYPGGDYASGAFVVLRYNPNGSLDSSFGSAGKTITDIDPNKSDGANAVAIDYSGSSATNPNFGKIYAAGRVSLGRNPSANEDAAFALVRYNANGTLDTSFGGAKAKGKVITNFSSGNEYAYGVAVQANGKVIVTGVGAGTNDLVLARYNPNGTLDGTFGAQGKMTANLGVELDLAGAGMVLQADGKVVVVGVTSSGTSILGRFNSNGSLDSSFGSAGIVTVDHWFRSLAVQPDGMIVAGGSESLEGAPFWRVARFQTTGSLDASFGTNGIAETQVHGVATAVAVDAVGRIVAAGWIHNVTTDVGAVRFTSSGGLDPTFGTEGVAQTSTSDAGERIGDIAIQPDGKIVLAGRTNSQSVGAPADLDIALLRYLGDDPLQAANALIEPPAKDGLLTQEDLEPILAEVFTRWQATEVDVSDFGSIHSNHQPRWPHARYGLRR